MDNQTLENTEEYVISECEAVHLRQLQAALVERQTELRAAVQMLLANRALSGATVDIKADFTKFRITNNGLANS